MRDVSIMIPTLNESLHLKRLLPRLKTLKLPFFVLDSYSDDDTTLLAKHYGGKVIQGQWRTFSEKLNFGLKKILIDLNGLFALMRMSTLIKIL